MIIASLVICQLIVPHPCCSSSPSLQVISQLRWHSYTEETVPPNYGDVTASTSGT